MCGDGCVDFGPLRERVWAVIASIPPGRVMTYGQIARMVGLPRGARQVGALLRHAPEGLPCHRVIRSDGRLAPEEVFGMGWQGLLLSSEGCVFKADGRVDITRCAANKNA